MTDSNNLLVPLVLIPQTFEKQPEKQYDDLEIKFPYSEGIATQVLCVLCGSGIPNKSTEINIKNNMVIVTGLNREPASLVHAVRASALAVFGEESDVPEKIEFRRIPKNKL
jgi:hypothetical protein